MELDKKIEYRKRFISKRQSMWNFIRRNRQFRVGDVMLVCGVNYNYMQKFLNFLENAKYIKLKNEKKPYTNRMYSLLVNSGPIAPSITDGGLYDENTKEEFIFGEMKGKRKVVVPDGLVEILKAIENNEPMTQDEISAKSGIQRKGLYKWWNRLEKFGVILGRVPADESDQKYSWCKVKYKTKDRKYLFAVDSKRAKVVLSEIEKGAYSKKTSQLRHLWLKN